MKHLNGLALLAPVLLLGCPMPPVTPPVPVPDTDLCARMCDRLSALQCEEGQSLYNSDLPGPVDVPNQTCAANCVELQDKGFFVNTKCVLTVDKCSQIEAFRQKDPATCG